jgi:hypothetical protein
MSMRKIAVEMKQALENWTIESIRWIWILILAIVLTASLVSTTRFHGRTVCAAYSSINAEYCAAAIARYQKP